MTAVELASTRAYILVLGSLVTGITLATCSTSHFYLAFDHCTLADLRLDATTSYPTLDLRKMHANFNPPITYSAALELNSTYLRAPICPTISHSPHLNSRPILKPDMAIPRPSLTSLSLVCKRLYESISTTRYPALRILCLGKGKLTVSAICVI